MNSDPVQGDDSRYRVIHYPGAEGVRREAEARASLEPPQADPQPSPSFATDAPPVIEPPPMRAGPEPWSSRNKALAGVAAAAVLGLGLGALLMPKTDKAAPDDKALAAATASHNPDDHLEIEVHKRAPPVQPVRTTGGKLDAASTVMAPAAGGAVASSVPAAQAAAKPESGGGVRGFLGRLFGGRDGDRSAPAQQATATPAPARPVRVAQAAPPRVQAQPEDDEGGTTDRSGPDAPRPPTPPWAGQPRPQPVAQTTPARSPGASPSFDCSYARTASEVMVCQVPSLASADRRMARAYADARRAGVPSDMLKAQQQRWYRARERAAVSPQAVGMVYEQRIAELEQLRQQAGHTQDDGDNDW